MNNEDTHITDSESPSIRNDVMDAIRKGKVHMRPRWHFVLLSALAALGAFILLLTALYVVSLSVFLLRDNGAWFAPSFGGRGWFSLLRSIPWVLILFVIIFTAVLEILVRRYRFVYRKPLLGSVALVLLVIFGGGFALAQTSFHRQMAFYARHKELPPPFDMPYGPMFRPIPPGDVYHGTIAAITGNGFILISEDDSTSTVVLTSKTRLPYGDDFQVGSEVVVVGDLTATDTVEAFGVRDASE